MIPALNHSLKDFRLSPLQHSVPLFLQTPKRGKKAFINRISFEVSQGLSPDFVNSDKEDKGGIFDLDWIQNRP